MDDLVVDQDWRPLAFSKSGRINPAGIVFAGYGIVSGPNNYLGFETNETVEDKIVIVLNYEPMNEDGSSQWREEGWSHNSRLTYKVTALDRRGAAGVIIVNPPNANDDRVDGHRDPNDTGDKGAGYREVAGLKVNSGAAGAGRHWHTSRCLAGS